MPPLRATLAAYQAPVLRRSLIQAGSTFALFFAALTAMYVLRHVSPLITLALSIPAAGLVVRIFIIQHDCGHGAYFQGGAANLWMGRLCSLITMTPFANWRRQHANHHAVWNDLDRRGSGADIYSTCKTVAEYRALTPFPRFAYRAARHPVIAQFLLPPLVFVLLYRVPFDTPKKWRRERNSVIATNLALAALFTTLVLLLGAGPVALVQLPTIAIAGILGVWLFSVQHRFESVLWARTTAWTATDAALLGSSYLRLPRVLQWFSGNIGFHHIHHLMPRIPNYRLEECHRACAAQVASTTTLSLREALAAPAFALWDEASSRMVRFSDVA
jgi:omega-6 fatty acid desaturase (delta-12 desaturase)